MPAGHAGNGGWNDGQTFEDRVSRSVLSCDIEGNERKDIFKSGADREKFLSCLATEAERHGALFHAWCLMTNHYHLMIETPLGNLSRIMKHINNSYTNYFNIKRKRSGHLLQGRYKAVLVQADIYATELSRYIHLNPMLDPVRGKYFGRS